MREARQEEEMRKRKAKVGKYCTENQMMVIEGAPDGELEEWWRLQAERRLEEEEMKRRGERRRLMAETWRRNGGLFPNDDDLRNLAPQEEGVGRVEREAIERDEDEKWAIAQYVNVNADQDDEEKYWQREGERMQDMAEEQALADVNDWEGHQLAEHIRTMETMNAQRDLDEESSLGLEEDYFHEAEPGERDELRQEDERVLEVLPETRRTHD